LVVVDWEFLEAAVLVTFIRSVSALSFAITHFGLSNTLTISASPLGGWVAATDFGAIEWILLEAAFLHHFIRLIRALGFTVTHLSLEGAFTIEASHLGLGVAAANFGAVVVESSEAAFLVAFI